MRDLAWQVPSINWLDAAIVAAIVSGVFALTKEAVTFGLDRLRAHWEQGREHKTRVKRAVAELLGIRHALRVHLKVGLEDLLAAFPEPLRIAVTSIPEARQMFEELMAELRPDVKGLAAQYDDAVAALSDVDPELSYRLRGSDLTLRLAAYLARKLPTVGAPPAAASVVFDLLYSEILPDLNADIRELAERLGPGERSRVQEALERQPPSNEELQKRMADLLQRAVERLGPLLNPPAAPAPQPLPPSVSAPKS